MNFSRTTRGIVLSTTAVVIAITGAGCRSMCSSGCAPERSASDAKVGEVLSSTADSIKQGSVDAKNRLKKLTVPSSPRNGEAASKIDSVATIKSSSNKPTQTPSGLASKMTEQAAKAKAIKAAERPAISLANAEPIQKPVSEIDAGVVKTSHVALSTDAAPLNSTDLDPLASAKVKKIIGDVADTSDSGDPAPPANAIKRATGHEIPTAKSAAEKIADRSRASSLDNLKSDAEPSTPASRLDKSTNLNGSATGERSTDFTWIRGRLTHIHSRGGFWQLRYAPHDKPDEFGGAFVLTGNLPSDLKEGDGVTVKGKPAGFSDRYQATVYQVTEITR
jgi:hypothetical protein